MSCKLCVASESWKRSAHAVVEELMTMTVVLVAGPSFSTRDVLRWTHLMPMIMYVIMDVSTGTAEIWLSGS